MNRNTGLYRLIVTAVLLALGMVLPFLTGQIPEIGQLVSPLHIPAFICGLTCGPVYGAALGFALPLVRSAVLGMPPLVPVALPMAFELCGYGLLCGLLYPLARRLLGKKAHWLSMLAALIVAMVGGRLLGGAAKAVVMGMGGNAYTFQAFVTAYFTGTAVGALIHLIIVPAVVTALEKARLSPMTHDENRQKTT